MSEVATELDVRGLNSPEPILRTRAILRNMKSGEILRVITTDPGSVKDIESFCGQTGNTLLPCPEDENKQFILIEKR